jgi:hypothetical protein
MSESINKALNYHLVGKEVSSIKHDMVSLTIIFKDGDDLTITASRDAEVYVTYNSTPDYDLAAAHKD